MIAEAINCVLTVFIYIYLFSFFLVENLHFCVLNFRYLIFFSQSITFNLTKEPIWNLDDGYTIQYNDDDFPFDVIPARTSGVSYYHRLVLRLPIMNNDFQSCPNRNLIEGFFVVSTDRIMFVLNL